MIAPSPDWFTGVQNVNLIASGDWTTKMTVPVAAYDSGSDSGTDFTSGNQPTNPRVPIFMINSGPLATNGVVPSLGNFIFERIDGGNECVANRTITDNPAVGNYNASQTIATNSNGPVEVTTAAHFKAGSSITLQAGFHAKSGSIFSATIENCASSSIAISSNPLNNLLGVALAPPSFSELVEKVGLQITPNPIYGDGDIQFFLPKSTIASVFILDRNGRLLHKLENGVLLPKGSHHLRFDGADLPAGMYFIQLRTKDQVVTRKAVLVR